MTRNKTWMVVGCFAAGTMLGGCSAGQIGQMVQWASDAVDVSIETDLDGNPRVALNVSGDRAAVRAQQRKYARMQDLAMERFLVDERLQERLVQMVAAEMFPDGLAAATSRVASGN